MSKKDDAKKDQEEAIKGLLKILRPGDTVYTILRHRSASGMTRHISAAINGKDGIDDITWRIARTCGIRMDRDTGGLVVGGCGMDMGAHVVYNLSRVLFQDASSFVCIGGDCPSNDHLNGMSRGKEHEGITTHSDGGYALRQRWL